MPREISRVCLLPELLPPPPADGDSRAKITLLMTWNADRPGRHVVGRQSHEFRRMRFPPIDDFPERIVQRARNAPGRVVFLHFREVAVIANVVPDARLIAVLPMHHSAGQRRELLEGFQDRYAIFESTADVVDLRDARRGEELPYKL